MIDNDLDEIICSIIIPMYNGEKFVMETIDSCLKQTFDRIEVIVIDDCSKDKSYNIVQALLANNPKLVLLKNKYNSGISKTVNIGASIAKGKYLLILGQDDLLDKKHIENILSEFDEDTAFVYCNAELIDKDGQIIGRSLNDIEQIQKNKKFMVYSTFSNIVSSTGAVICKKYFDKVGGWDEKYKNYGEWLLWIKLANIGKVKYTTRTYAKYRRHDTNITNTFQNEDVVKGLEEFKNNCRNLAVANINDLADKGLRMLLKFKNAIKHKIKNEK